MDAAQWAQQHQVGGFAKAMEEIPTPNSGSSINPTNNSSNPRGQPMLERRARPQKDQNLNCPRCNSTNTKFCYYNNYSLTQPRYFCKTCRRYWTQGGSLRNVPVGGGSRKNKRSSSSSSILASSSSSSIPLPTTPTMATKLIPDLNPPTGALSHLFSTAAPQNPKFLEGQDLNLAFPIQGIFHPMEHHHHHQFPKIEGTNNTNNENTPGNIPTTCTTAATNASCGGNSSTPISALELLRTGIASRGNLSSFVPMPMAMADSNTIYPSSGLIPNLQEFKPNMGSSVLSSPRDHPPHHGNDNNMIGSGAPNHGGDGARLLFPFADMNKLASSTTTTTTTEHNEIDDQGKARNDNDHQHHHHHHHHHHNNNHPQAPTGYWTGMLGGGTW